MKPPSRADALAATLIGIGVALRLYHFAARRSLWIDEARLALNVGGRSWAELAEPLWFDQTAPLLFLWAAKALFAFASHEWMLRLIPLAAGIGALPLIWWIGTRLLSARAALLLLAVTALSPVLVYFSNEFKPYGLDVFTTCLLLALTVRTLHEQRTWTMSALGIAGTIAPWASTPSPFVLAGCAAALLVAPGWTSRSQRGVRRICAVWTLSTVLCYVAILRPASANEYLAQFWAYRMLTPGADFGERAWEALKEVIAGTLGGLTARKGIAEVEKSLLSVAFLVVGTFGAAHLLRERPRPVAVAVLLPLVLTSLAAMAGIYPVALRVSLFAAPLWLIGFAAGIDRLAGVAPARRAVMAASILLLFAQPVLRTLRAVAHPLAWEHTRPAIEALQAARTLGEPVYVSAGAIPAWAFYTTNWEHPNQSRLKAYARAGSAGGPSFENAPSRGSAGGGPLPPTVVTEYGPELLGSSTGRQWLWGRGLSREEPDAHWADQEAERIRSAASPSAWVLSAHDFGAEGDLIGALHRHGGCVETRVESAAAVVVRTTFGREILCFPSGKRDAQVIGESSRVVAGLAPKDLRSEVQRPSLRLLVDAAYVLADDTEKDEVDPGEKRHHD